MGDKKPGRKKKELNLTTTSDDTSYVDTTRKKKIIDYPQSGKFTVGYDFCACFKELKEESDDKFKMFVAKDGERGFFGINFERKFISDCWFNSSLQLFGFIYSTSITGIPDVDVGGSKKGVCFKSSTKFNLKTMEKLFKNCGVITTERESTTNIGCNIPGEVDAFSPRTFMKKIKEEHKQLLSPKKTKIIRNDSDYELSQDEDNNVKSKKKESDSIKEDKRKIEDSPERPTKKVKKTDNPKQELSPSESEDVSDSEIVAKHHVTRSKTRSFRANLDLDKVVLSKYNIHITLRDISRLEPDEFLNDNIIDFYLRHLEDQFHGPKLKQVRNDFYIFNTHFYQLLKKDSSRAAERIAKNVALFKKKFIFIPVNENVHWSLIVICNPNGSTVKKDKTDTTKKYPPESRMLMYCDSLGGAIPSNTTKRVREFLAKRYSFEFPDKRQVSFTADNFPVGKANLPKQDNHVDCGVFMIHYIQLLVCANIESLPLDNPELFVPSDIPSKRSTIKREIEYEISLNPQPSQVEQSFNSQSDSVMAISQLDDSEMKDAAAEGGDTNTLEKKEEEIEQEGCENVKDAATTTTIDAESSSPKQETKETQESEDLFTEKVLERDNAE